MLRRNPNWSRVGTPTGIVTRINFSGRELTVGLAHLHSRCVPAERARQLATYLEFVSGRPGARFSAAI